jgi:hypothetical protein
MTRRIENPEHVAPDLFAPKPQCVTLPPPLRPQLAALVEALLAEIAASLATGEAGDEQDHV